MASNIDFKKLTEEDVSDDEKALVRVIARSYNTFGEQVVQALDGELDFNNLKQELRDIDVIVDANGLPTSNPAFKLSKVDRVNGMMCIRASNKTSSTVYPTSTPFVTYTQESDLVRITHISGLQADNRYALRLLIV